MFVRRKRSNKRKRKFYEALEFFYGQPIKEVTDFLGDYGKVMKGLDEDSIDVYSWVVLKDGRQIIPTQFILKDKQGKIFCFDLDIFSDWFIICQKK